MDDFDPNMFLEETNKLAYDMNRLKRDNRHLIKRVKMLESKVAENAAAILSGNFGEGGNKAHSKPKIRETVPTKRMLQLNKKPISSRESEGPAELIDPKGVWTFRPAKHHSPTDLMKRWRRIFDGQSSNSIIRGVPVILPRFLGGGVVQMELEGFGGGIRVHLLAYSGSVNDEVSLPIVGHLSMSIKGHEQESADGPFRLVEKGFQQLIVLFLSSCKGLSRKEFPEIEVHFTE